MKNYNKLFNMLPKQNRLTKNTDFDKFFGLKFKKLKGQSASTKNLLIKVLGNELSENRFGFVVNLKVDKRASARNKIKRQLREIIRQQFQQIKKPFDYVIIALPPIKNLDYQQIDQEVSLLLKKLNQLK